MLPVYLMGIGMFAVSACSKQETGTINIRPALAYKIGSGSLANSEIYAGEIHARIEADHAFRIGGKIIARLVDAGAKVKRGQALARLDPTDAKLAADAAQANLVAAQTDASVAEADYKRYADLLGKGFISQAVLDQKLSARNAAKARLDSAKSQADMAANQTAYATLSADQNGVVTQVIAEVGQVVAAGQPVLRLANPAEKELAINIPEAKISEFSRASRKEFRLALWSQPDKYYPAEVREIAAAADPVTRTYAARLSIGQADDAIQIGMTAYAISATTPASDVVSVPLSAVYIKDNVAGVWLIASDGKLSLKPVTIVQYRENAALIKGSVSAGNTIVAAGVHKLHVGDVVKPVFDAAITGDGKVANVGGAK